MTRLLASPTSKSKRALALAFVAFAALPASSFAATYTLNGVPAEPTIASDPAVMCSAIPSAAGVVACFDSETALTAAFRRDVLAGRIPAGFNVRPPQSEIDRLLGATAGTGVTATAARRQSRRVIAHAACSSGLADNHVYAAAAWTGTQRYFGSSGWVINAFDAQINNGITSYRNAEYYVYYFDYSTGSGGLGTYYDGASSHCVQRGNLASTDPSWDNTFSSYSSGA